MTGAVAADQYLRTWPGNEHRIEQFATLLRLFPGPGRLVDLGSGPGPFGSLAADAGWDVTAVDARATLLIDDSRIHQVVADVRQTSLDGYDLVLCLGLFYHLPVADQLDLLSRAAGTPMILDTHLATTEAVREQGYPGLTYREPGQGGLGDPLGSWGNVTSFWPTVQGFTAMALDSGYRLVLTAEPWCWPDRAFFICLP